jgi:hypothetical protein
MLIPEIKVILQRGGGGKFFIDTHNGDLLTKLVKLQSKLWLKRNGVNDDCSGTNKPNFNNINHCGIFSYENEIILDHMTTKGRIIESFEEFILQLSNQEFQGKIIFFEDPEFISKVYNDLISKEVNIPIRYDYIGALMIGIKSLIKKCNHRNLFSRSPNFVPQEMHFLSLLSFINKGGKYLEITLNNNFVKSVIFMNYESPTKPSAPVGK